MNKLLLFGSLFFLSAWQAGLSAANEGKLVVNVPKNIEGGGLVSIKGVVEDESLSSSNLVKLFIDGKDETNLTSRNKRHIEFQTKGTIQCTDENCFADILI